jgi:hypothetical protein
LTESWDDEREHGGDTGLRIGSRMSHGIQGDADLSFPQVHPRRLRLYEFCGFE